jgi:hypothetical protein
MRKMMAKSPEERYQSYNHLLDELKKLEGIEEVEETPAPEAPKTSRPVRQPPGETKKKAPAFLLIVPVLILAGLAGYLVFGAGGGDAPPSAPTQKEDKATVNTLSVRVEPPSPAADSEDGLFLVEEENEPVGLSLVEQPFEKLTDDSYRFFGSIVNMGRESVDGIHIEVALIDVFGDLIAKQAIQVEPAVVMPGESARYSILLKDAGQRFERYSIRVWDISDPEKDIPLLEPGEEPSPQ